MGLSEGAFACEPRGTGRVGRGMRGIRVGDRIPGGLDEEGSGSYNKAAAEGLLREVG